MFLDAYLYISTSRTILKHVLGSNLRHLEVYYDIIYLNVFFQLTIFVYPLLPVEYTFNAQGVNKNLKFINLYI